MGAGGFGVVQDRGQKNSRRRHDRVALQRPLRATGGEGRWSAAARGVALGLRRRDGVEGVPGERLVAGSHEARICSPLWKVHTPRVLPRAPSERTIALALPALCLGAVGVARGAWRMHASAAHAPPAYVHGRRLLRVLLPAQLLKPMQIEGVQWLFGAIQGGGGILARTTRAWAKRCR